MPKLLVFAVCEKIIVDDSGNATLITLLNEIHIALPTDGTVLPPDALAPKEWAVFAMWAVEQEDFGHDFVQEMEMSFEDGTIFKKQSLPFHVKPDVRVAVNRANIIGFPIGKQGSFTVTVWLRGDGTNIDRDKHSYPVFVVHKAASVTASQLSGLAGVRRL